MILIASPSKPFEYTSKGNLRRQRVLDAYTSEINALYELISESTQEDIAGPTEWTSHETRLFVKDVIARTLKTRSTAIDDDADLFEHGLDRFEHILLGPIPCLLSFRSSPQSSGNMDTKYCPSSTAQSQPKVRK